MQPLRAALEALDPAVRVSTSLGVDGFRRELERPKVLASLALGGGAIALGLALIGLFGVTAFVIEQRIHEISVRRALGATPRQLLGMLLQDSLRPVLIGLGFGLFASLLGGTVVESVLLGVSSRDPVSILSAALVLFGAATPRRHDSGAATSGSRSGAVAQAGVKGGLTYSVREWPSLIA